MNLERIRYIVLQCVSSEMNPAFESGDVPYAWTHRIDARKAEDWKRKIEAAHGNVTVTIREADG